MAGRHGNKGVIAHFRRRKICLSLSDGEPVDIVPTRWVPSSNIGQVLRLTCQRPHPRLKIATRCSTGPAKRKSETCWSELLPADGKTSYAMGGPVCQLDNPITVGHIYMPAGPLSMIRSMPVPPVRTAGYPAAQGKAHLVAMVQEMEVWA